MRKALITVIAILSIELLFCQVGINTESPITNLDVVGGKYENGEFRTDEATGMQAPRISREELTGKGENVYDQNHDGAIIYVTNVNTGNADENSQRRNITSPGYYYYNRSINYWENLSPSKNTVNLGFLGFFESDNIVAPISSPARVPIVIPFQKVKNSSVVNHSIEEQNGVKFSVFTVTKKGFYQFTVFVEKSIDAFYTDPNLVTGGSSIIAIRVNGTALYSQLDGYRDGTDMISQSFTQTAELNIGDKVSISTNYTRDYKVLNAEVSAIYLGS